MKIYTIKVSSKKSTILFDDGEVNGVFDTNNLPSFKYTISKEGYTHRYSLHSGDGVTVELWAKCNDPVDQLH